MTLFAAVDVDYRGTYAIAACAWFDRWDADAPVGEVTARVEDIAPYEPGSFYKRELPCLLEVLARAPEVSVVVIDGYVTLDGGKPGLGAHLHDELARSAAVIGVAKTEYRGATGVVQVLRGESTQPLWVTAAGVDVNDAARWVGSMHGPHRIPTLLKHVDALARAG